jgi:eukaryotic-like serine/threonine-protein kinase
MHDEPTLPMGALAPGAAIGQYRLLDRLGAGGMGEVYRARDTVLERDVALKFLAAHLAQDADHRRRFLREAQAAARLAHPNIVTIHDVIEHAGRPVFVMEHVEGRPLDRFDDDRPPAFAMILELALQLADALRAAHAGGVVHRDIKPSNILVDRTGRVRVVDFGIASLAGARELTRTGSTLGTVGYMSPEQALGREADHRSDLFSLGVVLYELAAGRHPFRRDTEAATLHAITHDAPPPLADLRADLPAPFCALVERLLAKEAPRRCRDAAEVREALVALRPACATVPAPAAAAPSVAVLPFVNLSADPDQTYFCDGITEDIISDLNHVPGLRVVARTSAFAFRDRGGDIREIGRQLGVSHVVEGSVRKAGPRVRVAAQLVDVAGGYQLWSERYDRELSDIFAIQDDIARTIVDKLQLTLGRLAARPRGAAEVPVEAYQFYSRARHEMSQRSAAGLHRALAYLQQALALAPDYAAAHAGLADACFLLFAYDDLPPRDAIARARTAAQRALEIDERLADAHATLGGIHTYHDWAWADAERAFLQALQLSPGHGTAHQWYGELLSYLGRRDDAERHLQTALQRDPLSVVALTMLGWHHVRHEQYREALPYLERAESLDAANDFPYALSGWSRFALGDHDAAAADFLRGRTVAGTTALGLTVEALTCARRGDRSHAGLALAALREREAAQYVPQPYLAALHHALGDADAAVACLHEALRRRDAELILMAVMPYYREVRRDARLGPLLAVLGLDAQPTSADAG